MLAHARPRASPGLRPTRPGAPPPTPRSSSPHPPRRTVGRPAPSPGLPSPSSPALRAAPRRSARSARSARRASAPPALSGPGAAAALYSASGSLAGSPSSGPDRGQSRIPAWNRTRSRPRTAGHLPLVVPTPNRPARAPSLPLAACPSGPTWVLCAQCSETLPCVYPLHDPQHRPGNSPCLPAART